MPVAIVSDTCHYLPAELTSVNELHLVSLYVHRNEGAQREAEISDYAEYYRQLRDLGGLPTTSQPSVGDFLTVYEPLLDSGHDIVSIHLAGGMSGTVGSAQQARESLGERAQRVHVIDSATACGGEGLVVLAAAAGVRAGEDAATVAARAHAARAELKMWFSIDTLEYLRRGGRIAGAQAWLGAALRIKPILTVESEITPVERVRTSRRAFERMVEFLALCKQEGRDAWMVNHIQAPDEAEKLVSRGIEIFGVGPVAVAEVGPVIGTHVGPGLLGVGGVPRSFI